MERFLAYCRKHGAFLDLATAVAAYKVFIQIHSLALPPSLDELRRAGVATGKSVDGRTVDGRTVGQSDSRTVGREGAPTSEENPAGRQTVAPGGARYGDPALHARERSSALGLPAVAGSTRSTNGCEPKAIRRRINSPVRQAQGPESLDRLGTWSMSKRPVEGPAGHAFPRTARRRAPALQSENQAPRVDLLLSTTTGRLGFVRRLT